MAGLRSLEPSIGVRIPVPQLNQGGPSALGFLSSYGACSSMVEHQIVDLGVVGSSPIKRPISLTLHEG